MIIATRVSSFILLCCAASMSVAQPPAPSAQSEAGEPRADTSSGTKPAQPAAKERPAAGNSAPAPVRAAPPPAAGATAKAQNGPAPKGQDGPKAPAKTDRLDLGLATVTGEREQPKVMYIVPWKKSDIGDLAGKPMNSLVDEILSPVDRDVFKREVVYYKAVQADASQNGARREPAQQGEK
jgi:hypothetical protein